MVESVIAPQEQVSLYPFYHNNVFFEILAYVVAVTIIIACVYLCCFFVKRLIRLFKSS